VDSAHIISLCERYEKLYVPAVADILDDHGLWNQLLPKEIMPLQLGQKAAGPAFTAKGHATTKLDTGLGARVMEGLAPGCIAVWDTTGDTTTGHWGELMSTSAMAKGCRGAVVDGGIRDTDYIRGHGFPVWSRFRSAADAMGRWTIEEAQLPIVIGSVTIRPGDFVFADSDGVVLVPQDLVEDVLAEAERVVASENKIRVALVSGGVLADQYKSFGLHEPEHGRV
jgi:regulator of RNase E activity RraA